MFTIQRSVPAFLVAIGLTVTPACVAQRSYYSGQLDYRDVELRAYDDGYRRGIENGQRDARDRRDFRVDRDRAYRDANNRDWGRDRDRFSRFFRTAIAKATPEATTGWRGTTAAGRIRTDRPQAIWERQDLRRRQRKSATATGWTSDATTRTTARATIHGGQRAIVKAIAITTTAMARATRCGEVTRGVCAGVKRLSRRPPVTNARHRARRDRAVSPRCASPTSIRVSTIGPSRLVILARESDGARRDRCCRGKSMIPGSGCEGFEPRSRG